MTRNSIINDSIDQNYDVLFIGAGPVGLYTAIQAKLYNPKLNIVMFERHETYVRNHILIINPKSYSNSHPDLRFQAMLKELKGPVLTTKIEQDLKGFAEQLGIAFQHRKIEDVDALSLEYPNAQTIVGADGSRSLVRQQIFNGKKSIDDALQYIVEVKYKAKGVAVKLEPARYGLALSQVKHFVSEHVGKYNEDTGETPISLFFFVDKPTYDEVKRLGGSAASGLKLGDIKPEISTHLDQLANSIRPWMAARKFCKEYYVNRSEKIAAVELPAYRSETFAKQTNSGPNVLLVGDAAMGVPFFRALNAGFIGANEAARLMTHQSKHETISQYNNFMNNLSDKEIKKARWQSTKADIGQFLASTQRKLSKSFAVSMRPDMLQKMQQARVRPANIFIRNPRITTAVILLAILIPVLILTGGVGVIPVIGAVLSHAIGAYAANVIAASAVVLLTSVLFKSCEFIIAGLRKKPLVDLPELNTGKLPWESDESTESSDEAYYSSHRTVLSALDATNDTSSRSSISYETDYYSAESPDSQDAFSDFSEDFTENDSSFSPGIG